MQIRSSIAPSRSFIPLASAICTTVRPNLLLPRCIERIAVKAEVARCAEVELTAGQRHLAVAGHLQPGLPDRDDKALTDVERHFATDCLAAGLCDLDGAVVAGLDLAVLLHAERVIVADLDLPIVPDVLCVIVEHVRGEIPLRMEIDLFTAARVLEAQLVEAGPLVGLRLDC